jgi:hypothetical protein
MNTSQVIKYMDYNKDSYSLIDCGVANISWTYFLKVKLRLKRLKRYKSICTRLKFMSKKV